MNILIINQPLNNRGDESAHKALVRSLLKERPNDNIRILFTSANADSIRQFTVNASNVEYINVPVYRGGGKISQLATRLELPFLWNFDIAARTYKKYTKWADCVICAPGGICMGGFQNWAHIIYLSIARYLKKPIVYYGRSFGPFPEKTRMNRYFKKVSMGLLRYFCFLSLRDKKSEVLANSLGLTYTSTVDTAFLDNPQVGIPNEVQKTIGQQNYVVFVPNLLIWHYAFKNKISLENVIDFYKKIYIKYIEQFPDCKVIMLPQTFNYGNYNGDDIHFFRDFASAINDDNLVVMPDIYSSDIQQTIIRGAKCMVGARYHSVVFAINQNIPFVALSYEHKIVGLLDTLRITNNMVDITGIIQGQSMINAIVADFADKIKDVRVLTTPSDEAKLIARRCLENLLIKLDDLDSLK